MKDIRLLLIWFILAGLYPGVTVHAFTETIVLIDSLNEDAWKLRKTDPQQAMILATKALTLAREMEYPTGIGTSYNRLGLLYRQNGEYKIAEEYYLKSIQIRKSVGDTTGAMGVQNNLGALYRRTGKFEEAYKVLYEAAEYFENKKIENYLIKVRENIANTMEDENKDEQALEQYLKVLETYLASENTHGLCRTFYNIANSYSQLGELDLAMQKVDKALPLYHSLDNWEGEAKAWNLKGTIFLKKNDLKSAEECFQKGIAICEENEDCGLTFFDLHMNYGILLLDINQAVKSLQKLKTAQRLIDDDKGGLEDHLLLNVNLATAFTKLNQYDSAWAYQWHATALQDSLYKVESTQAIADMEVRYNVKGTLKNLTEVQLLNKELKLRRVKK